MKSIEIEEDLYNKARKYCDKNNIVFVDFIEDIILNEINVSEHNSSPDRDHVIKKQPPEKEKLHKAKTENHKKDSCGFGLEKKWFHSFTKEGVVRWQGQVLSLIGKDRALIQLYSWMDGCPTVQKIIDISEFSTFSFFNTDEDMNFAYENKYSDQKKGIYKRDGYQK
jgi:hypothetical protein